MYFTNPKDCDFQLCELRVSCLFADFAVKIWIFTAEHAEIGKDAENAKGKVCFVSMKS
jgi:hypothetical protein